MHKEPLANVKAPVIKIIPFSCVDGPGNRSAVFFQGCGFHCQYCHNPETINLCKHCRRCVLVCPVKALSVHGEKVMWDCERCCGCDTCIKTCTYNSSPRIRYMTTDDVIAAITDSLPFIQGITTSGGECTLYHHFIAELFEKIHRLGKTAFVDSNGQIDFRQIPHLIDVTDKVMLDIKSVDEQEHRMLTGQSCKVVLDNLHYLLSIDKLFEIRTVIVPGILDNFRTVDIASKMISAWPTVRYKLIKFRTWGVKGALLNTEIPDDSLMKELENLIRHNGVSNVVIV